MTIFRYRKNYTETEMIILSTRFEFKNRKVITEKQA